MTGVLETEVCECAVGLSHLVHVFLALERATLLVECVDDLSGQFVGHRLSATATGIKDKVLHRYRFLTIRADLSRNLESGTTHTAALHFNLRSNILKRLLPDFEGSLLLIGQFCFYSVQCSVKYSVRSILLAVIGFAFLIFFLQ